MCTEDAIVKSAMDGCEGTFPSEFLSKKYYHDASELMDLKDRVVIPWLNFLVPYSVRYASWTLYISGYLATAMCVSYLWCFLLRVAPDTMQEKLRKLQAIYHELLMWWQNQVKWLVLLGKGYAAYQEWTGRYV